MDSELNPSDDHSMNIEHPSTHPLIDITIDSEHDTDRGWGYCVTMSWKSRGETSHEITLSWVDHDQLTGGSVPPSQLVEQVATIAARAIGIDELPSKFDVSSMRRAIPEFERLLRD